MGCLLFLNMNKKEFFSKKIVEIKRYCEYIYFKPPTETKQKQYIQKICSDLNISVPEYGIQLIYKNSQGDYRRILHIINSLLLNLSPKKNKIKSLKACIINSPRIPS